MTYGIWIGVLVAGMACGAALVTLLVVRRPLEPVMALASLALLGVNSVIVVRAATLYEQGPITVAIGVTSLAAAAGGYGLASSLLAPLFGPRPTRLAALSVIPRDPGAAATALLLLCSCEPERYSPRRVAADLASLGDAGLPDAGLVIAPFLYAAQKARLRAMGGTSPAAASARRLAARLAEDSGTTDTRPRVEVVDCSDPEALARTIIALVAQGFVNFIGVSLFVGDSYEFDRATSILGALRPEDAGLGIVYTPTLWASEPLAEELARRILAAAPEPASAGVALVMHGQPDERQRSHGSFDVQEDSFANRIRMLVTEYGIPDSAVRLCFHDWETPDVTETVRHLAAVGCKHVVVAPVCFPLDGSQTILDMPISVSQARVDEHVSTLTLPAWGESDAVVAVLRDAVAAAIRESGFELGS